MQTRKPLIWPALVPAIGWLLVVVQPANAQPVYSLVDLGDLPGGSDSSSAYDLNNSGQVVGVSFDGIGTRGFIWDAVGGMRTLDDLPTGITWDPARSINDAGVVAGSLGVQAGATAYLWDSVNGRRLLVDPVAGDGSTDAYGINASSQVAGQFYTFGLNQPGRGAFWSDESAPALQLPTVPGTVPQQSHRAVAINDAGQVVGSAFDLGPSNEAMAFLWDETNGLQALGSLPGGTDASQANGLNNLGQVVGRSSVAGTMHAFLWDSVGGMRDLNPIGSEDLFTDARDVNDSGVVVGQILAGYGFVWDSAHGMRELTDLLDASGAGWTIKDAVAINERGWIAATARSSEGHNHAVLLIPEPATAALLIGSFLLMRRRRTRTAVA